MFGRMGGYGNGFGFGHGYGFMGGFSQLLFLLLIGLVIYLIVKKSSITSTKTLFKTSSNIEAKEIVKLRYARGEISFDEYQKIMNSLN